MYLKEIGFISKSVMSDNVTIQVCSGFEQNRRHFQRSPCNLGIHNPDPIYHHLGDLYTRSYPVQRQSIGYPIVFATPGLQPVSYTHLTLPTTPYV